MTETRRDLAWRCRRGTRELDLLLSAYLERAYPTASGDERARFEALLEQRDSELQALFFGKSQDAHAFGDLPARILAIAAVSA